MCGAAIILNGPAVILCGMTSIWSNVHDILHVQHQFFEIFLGVMGFSKGKIHFFPKVTFTIQNKKVSVILLCSLGVSNKILINPLSTLVVTCPI